LVASWAVAWVVWRAVCWAARLESSKAGWRVASRVAHWADLKVYNWAAAWVDWWVVYLVGLWAVLMAVPMAVPMES